MKTIFVSMNSARCQVVCESDEIVETSGLKRFLVKKLEPLNKDDELRDVYLCRNGRKLHDGERLLDGDVVHVCHRLPGGKGGFGSMLRAIGAQIEKTTNREACRDLSGRRLRDINEEMRLKKWIAKQAEERKDKVALKIEALEKKLATPKHEFNDTNYDKMRGDITDRVNDAVAQGLATAKSGVKRPAASETAPKPKKPKLWMGVDEELDDDSDASSDQSDSDQSKASSTSDNNAGTSTTTAEDSNSADQPSTSADQPSTSSS